MHGPWLLIPISGMIMLEINHLKWIWWEYWACGRCGAKNKDCDCRSKWIMYL